MVVRLKVFRYDPERDERPYFRSYEVDGEPSDRLLDCLNRIRWEQDPTLSFRMSCGHGVCGSDGMRIDGVCGLPCQKLVKAFDHEVLIEPLPVFRVIKDLVVDLMPFFEKYRSVKPYLITQSDPPEKERIQSPEEQREFEECNPLYPLWLLYRLVPCQPTGGDGRLCWSCRPRPGVSATSSTHGTRGQLSALPRSTGKKGRGAVRPSGNAPKVCPKEIPVTRQIGRIKKRLYETRKQGK